MRKIKEVLRLHSLGLAQRQIARSCSIGQSTVSEYLKAAEAAQLSWSEVADWDESRLVAALIRKAPPRPKPDRQPAPDFAAMRAELRQHKHLTRQLLWEEYRATQPDGYGYSRFCELYQRWLRKQEVVLRQEHRAGEKLFVDYAGQTVPVQDPVTGEIREAELFVAVLGGEQLHLRRGHLDPGARRLDRLPPAGLRVLQRSARDRGAGQPEVRRDKGLPLRARREPHLRGDGPALWRGRGAGAAAQTAG